MTTITNKLEETNQLINLENSKKQEEKSKLNKEKLEKKKKIIDDFKNQKCENIFLTKILQEQIDYINLGENDTYSIHNYSKDHKFYEDTITVEKLIDILTTIVLDLEPLLYGLIVEKKYDEIINAIVLINNIDGISFTKLKYTGNKNIANLKDDNEFLNIIEYNQTVNNYLFKWNIKSNTITVRFRNILNMYTILINNLYKQIKQYNNINNIDNIIDLNNELISLKLGNFKNFETNYNIILNYKNLDILLFNSVKKHNKQKTNTKLKITSSETIENKISKIKNNKLNVSTDKNIPIYNELDFTNFGNNTSIYNDLTSDLTSDLTNDLNINANNIYNA